MIECNSCRKDRWWQETWRTATESNKAIESNMERHSRCSGQGKQKTEVTTKNRIDNGLRMW